jgi:ribonuclease HI
MKTLKFASDLVESIKSGSKKSTWHLFDDKQLGVNDLVEFINSDLGQAFGFAKINEVIMKRICDINDDDKSIHEGPEESEEILNLFRKYYGSNVTPDDIVKIIKFDYLGDKLPDKEVNNTTKITEVKIYTDGGSRGNPGPSAAGFIITDLQGKTIDKGGGYLGITTNNQAEYQAVKMALQQAAKMQLKQVHILMDSLLVANQMNGIYKIRNRDLWPIHQAITELISGFEKVSFTHIPRELNRLADEQVNIILDNQDKTGIVSELV